MKSITRSPILYRALAPLYLSSPRQLLLRPFLQRQHLSTTSTTSDTSLDTIITSENQHTSSPISETISTSTSTTEFEPLSYHVHRTPSQQLPVYHLAKAGGNKHQTRIRKISGSVEDLKDDLRLALGLAEKDIIINNVNRHIVIKGWKKYEVAKFLEEKRF